MHLQLLGPVEASLDGRPIPLGATKQRALLAMLALQANATVPVDRLVDGLWGEDPPATAPKMVQLYVSHLRRLLSGDDVRIVTHGRGYALCVPEDAVDAARFQHLVELAGRADGEAAGAAREGLALWHGAALADVAGEPFAAPEVRRLDELWLRAAELVVDGDLAAGRDEEALAQLERLIQDHPLRERLHEQRMLALYRSGRQAEALDAYVAARRRLVDEVGVEPGADLQALHERILRHDPALRRPASASAGAEPAAAASPEAEPAPAPGPPPARRLGRGRARPPTVWALLIAAALVVLAAGGAFALSRLTGDDALSGIAEGWVGVIDTHDVAITAQYRISREPQAIAAGAGSVWIANPDAGTVSRVHRDRDRVGTIDVGPLSAPAALAYGAGALWVAGGEDGVVAQVDPAADRVVHRITIGNGLRALAIGHGALWAATALDGEVVRFDLRQGRITRRIPVGGQPIGLAVTRNAVWVAAEESGQVIRIDPGSGEIVKAIDVGNNPSAVAAGLGAVWTANRQDGTVSRIDPATDQVTATRPAGHAPAALAIAAGAVWVGDAAGAVLRLNPRTVAITDTVRTGSSPGGLATVEDGVWVTAGASPTAHRGGTLRVGRPPIAMDPAKGGYDPSGTAVFELAYDGLVRYRRAAGAAGARLVGGLAVDVPEPVAGGRRYVFRLRRGVRYSDGTPVRAGDFRASLERMLIIQGRELPPLYDAIVGASACRTAPRRCDLSRGIAADERAATVTLRLRRPDPELPQKLTLPLAVVLPASAPRRAVPGPIPGTGPYRVRSVVPHRRTLLIRNPWFRPAQAPGRPAGFADRVEVRMADDEDANVAAVEHGRLDLAGIFEPTAQELAALRTRVGSRLRSGPFAKTIYAWLNTKAPPFDDRRVRLALSLAVDRRRAVDALGGRDTGRPTCQLLPPGLPGYRPVCPSTAAPSPAGAWSAPDRTKAQQLVATSPRRGGRVQVWSPRTWRGVGRQLVAALADLGFRSRLRLFKALGPLNDAAHDARRRPQIGLNGWIADYPEPGGFLRPVVSCASGASRDPGTINVSRFCDPALDAAIDRAQAAGPAAGGAWQRIDRSIALQAPVIPLINGRYPIVTSPRTGNVQFHPLSGPLLDQIWVR